MQTPLNPTATASGQNGPGLCVFGAMLRGSIGFALVSLAGFAVWAFCGKWLYANLGEAGLYFACLIVFLGASGLFLHSLVRGPRSLPRFYAIFIPSFVAYAIIWCAVWFTLRFGLGEWMASLAASVCFVAVAGRGLRNYNGFIKASVVLFGFHSVGYFLGGKLMYWMAGPAGKAILAGFSKAHISVLAKLGWGLLYGLSFGAGIGHVFYTFQRQGNHTSESAGQESSVACE
jgi:hypothetical protein